MATELLQCLGIQCVRTLHLHVDRNATPVAVHKPALVSIHWQDQLYSDLERDFRIGVLERVNQNTCITGCSRMVVTSKANGTPKRTVDLQPLYRHSVRQAHHVPSPFHLADRVQQGMKNTVADAWNGYHSVSIREEDRHITTHYHTLHYHSVGEGSVQGGTTGILGQQRCLQTAVWRHHRRFP